MPAERDPEATTEDLLAVANTEHGPEALYPMPPGDLQERYDHLANATAAVTFLRARVRSLPRGIPSARDLAVLAELRSAVRALAGGDRTLFGRLSRRLLERFRYRLGEDGSVVPEAAGWLGFAAALLPALLELSRETARLRVCSNPGCGWVFYDRSRKGHRLWCSPVSCGNRSKVRRYRSREKRRSRQEAALLRRTEGVHT